MEKSDTDYDTLLGVEVMIQFSDGNYQMVKVAKKIIDKYQK